ASQPIPDRLNAERSAIEDNGYLAQVLAGHKQSLKGNVSFIVRFCKGQELFPGRSSFCPVSEVLSTAQTSASPGGYCQNMDNLQHCTYSRAVFTSFFGLPALVPL